MKKSIVLPALLIAAALSGGCNLDALNRPSKEQTAQEDRRYGECFRQKNAFRDQVKSIYDGKTEQKIDVGGVEIRVGDLLKVADGSWVDVMNLETVVNDKADTWVKKNAVEMKPEPIEHDLRCDDGYLDNCHTDKGVIEVLGFTNDNLALVQYTPTGDYSGQTTCPPGIQYFVPAAKLAELKK